MPARAPHRGHLFTLIGPTQAEIRKEISEEEAKTNAEKGYIPLHDVSPSGFITTGIDLEEQQYAYVTSMWKCALLIHICQTSLTS